MDSEAIAVLVLVALPVVVGLALRHRARRARARFDAGALSAEAEVLDILPESSGAFRLRYRFTPAGTGGAITCEEIAGCLRATLPEVGERVAVRYDPLDPRRARFVRGA
ncbi:MAG: hypothetical protein OEW21_03850 [Betaproteobacteria bacterium]|nr:hypothetical protein [Betaproteobacteria bacterium]